ncbi:phosphoribosylanthranilate isomerase [uncultured Anaeromusa sp.]|uniref:phosphoribosylanthranilate isomerase n=1 Tax=uncultured Anaeromusa sp. TaxID=673273 RepID=UPI0029C8EBEC|nr:phosphoribosylanthranilate isomerase [uncultured Anaeromusa sp.]
MKIKICGLRRPEEADVVRACGGDYLGAVFALSPRQVDVLQAQSLFAAAGSVGRVGVFQNAPLAQVQEIAQACQLDLVQLHGEENEAYARAVGRPVLRSVPVTPGETLAKALLQRSGYAGLLLDTKLPGQSGGTGKTFAWAELQALRREAKSPLWVAGGLTTANVTEAIQLLRPDGVDVSGGVESSRGVKDCAAIAAFIAAARQAEEEYLAEPYCGEQTPGSGRSET